MWFNSLRVYRLTKSFEYQPEVLAEQLQSNLFHPCGKQESYRLGWFPPLGHQGKSLVHAANGNMMICAKRQEKVLPGAVINEALEEKIRTIQSQEGRAVSRRERQDLKEEIEFELLPKAMTKSSLQFGYIAPADNRVIINTGSAKKAEDFLGLLRDSLGSLSVVPFATKNQPMQSMTHWLKSSAMPGEFEFGDECELASLKDEGRSIRCKKHDLSADEVIRHLDTGMVVKRLGAVWQDHIECIIEHDLTLKRMKFSDAVTDQVDDRQPESAAEEFDLDFNIMALEIRSFLNALTNAFGGLSQQARSDDAD